MSWKHKESEFTRGKSGKAKLLVKGEKIVVVFAEDSKKPYPCVLDECMTPVPEKPEGLYSVSLTGDNNKIFSCSPWKGSYKAKFLKFAGRKGEPPIPREKEGQYGQYFQYYPVFKIIDGKNKGLEIPWFLIYKFPDIEGMVGFGGKKASSTKKNIAFINETGIGEEQLEWEANLLPTFDQIAISKGYTITIVLNDGYIETIIRDEADDSDFGDDGDDWEDDIDFGDDEIVDEPPF